MQLKVLNLSDPADNFWINLFSGKLKSFHQSFVESVLNIHCQREAKVKVKKSLKKRRAELGLDHTCPLEK